MKRLFLLSKKALSLDDRNIQAYTLIGEVYLKKEERQSLTLTLKAQRFSLRLPEINLI